MDISFREEEDLNCTPSALLNFPSDGFTRQDRLQGWVVIHLLVSCYVFMAITVLCNEYFVPAVERLSIVCNMSADVAGATFMAIATSAPELCVNIIGTFLTHGDLGIGTIVGSAVFNTLGVTAICGIAAGVTIQLDWWPLTRDCAAYALTISTLICILWDSVVKWYEAICLIALYVVYLLVLCNDKRMQVFVKNNVLCKKLPCCSIDNKLDENRETTNAEEDAAEDQPMYEFYALPRGQHIVWQLVWGIQFPIRAMYFISIPDVRYPKLKNFFILSFIMSSFWMAILTFLVSWALTAFGDTFNIPDSVMGITFLAIGTSIPEAATSVIVARRGYGSMAVCNSIGSNSFDVLICLGLPWLIKTFAVPTEDGKYHLLINSTGIVYTTITLLSALAILYIAFTCNKFTLGRKVGISCCIVYLGFLACATLNELNIFKKSNLPFCDHD